MLRRMTMFTRATLFLLDLQYTLSNGKLTTALFDGFLVLLT
jgi:hypothetical protein